MCGQWTQALTAKGGTSLPLDETADTTVLF